MRSFSSAPARWLALALVAPLLVGCTASGVQRGEPGSTDVPTAATVPPGPNGADVDAARVAAGISDCPEEDTGAEPRPDGLPELALPCLGGGSEVELSGLRGQPMMINVWASWCRPCRQEAPHLAEVAAQSEDQLLTVGLLYEESDKQAAIALAEASGQRYPQLVDDDRQVQEPLRVPGPPVTLFVTADGRLAHTQVGPFQGPEQIRALLAEHLGVSVPG